METATKNGYKMTELGLIPSDWDVVSVEFCLDLLTDFEANGSFEDVAKNVSIFDFDGFAWYVRATDLENNSDLRKVKYVNESTYKFLRKTMLFGGELLITKRGEIGKVYFFNRKTEYATLAPNLYLLKLNEKIVPNFAYFYFKGFGNKLLIEKNASSTLGALYKDDVKSILIPLPPLPEQIAIATALKDTDDLINSLENLIAKKKLIKQGAMQELLKPKEGWEKKKLGEVCELITKGTTPTSVGKDFQNEGINFIKIESLEPNGNIIRNKVAFIDESTHWVLKRSQLKSNDILFSIAGALGRVAIVSENLLPANTNQALAIIRLNNSEAFWYKYIYYFLNAESIQKHILSISVQGAQANLSLLNIYELEIDFPNINIQKGIAFALSTIESEISALEAKLIKLQTIKQGMMQQLLTGKIRFI